jgi:hypothetical protein
MRKWSTRAKANAYKRMVAKLEEIGNDVDAVRRMLIKEIPTGETVEGVQHSLVSSSRVLEDEVKRLGYYNQVRSDQIDGGKLSGLVKLHPELKEVVYEQKSPSHRLVIRDNHK